MLSIAHQCIHQVDSNLIDQDDLLPQHNLAHVTRSQLQKDLNFFVRFDKDQWVKNGKLELTDAGNCFHLKIGIAAFPKKREIALNAIRELFA